MKKSGNELPTLYTYCTALRPTCPNTCTDLDRRISRCHSNCGRHDNGTSHTSYRSSLQRNKDVSHHITYLTHYLVVCYVYVVGNILVK